MILGIGTDIVAISRIKKIHQKFPAFAYRILSDKELEIYNLLILEQKIRFLAKRFAGKEAVAKAMGIGIGVMGLRNISILNNKQGKPYIDMAVPANFDKSNIICKISLSDEVEYAIAFAILENISN